METKVIGKENLPSPVTIGDVLKQKKLQAEKEKQAAIKQGNTAATDKQPVK